MANDAINQHDVKVVISLMSATRGAGAAIREAWRFVMHERRKHMERKDRSVDPLFLSGIAVSTRQWSGTGLQSDSERKIELLDNKVSKGY